MGRKNIEKQRSGEGEKNRFRLFEKWYSRGLLILLVVTLAAEKTSGFQLKAYRNQRTCPSPNLILPCHCLIRPRGECRM